VNPAESPWEGECHALELLWFLGDCVAQTIQLRPRRHPNACAQHGLAAGLEEKLFQPQPEQKKDFYAELPIKIRLSGSYHQFGEFVSGIAALPRIVTLHDIDIRSENKDAYDQLSLELTAKTYRYLDEDEIAAGEADKKKAVRRQ